MQLTIEKRAIISNFEGKELGFQIDTTGPWIFELLRKQFYADPIGSICREISDNARDAHREVGKQHVPVEIWMPGEYLIIKDHGPGLSPQRVEEIYRFYGKSTKRGDNIQGGGFGIGAKTPFAYTDQFLVETVYDQMKYVWLNYLDETHVGKLKLISQQETLDKNYTAIKIPIEFYGKQDFINKILHFTKFWYLTGDAQPKYHGTIVDNTVKPVMESPTKNWVIFDKDQGVNVIVNGIPYDTDLVNVPDGCVLIFQVGELDLTANREKLRETDRTKLALKDKEQVLHNEIHEILQKDIANLTIDKLVDLIDKFKISQREWEYNGVKFTYPLKKHYTGLSIYRWRGSLEFNTTNKPSHNIYVYDTDDRYEISSYTKQKLKQALKESGKSGTLIRRDETEPFFSLFPKIDVSNIKIKHSNSGSYTKRERKKCLIYNIKSRRTEEVDYNNQGDERIYYITNSLRINQRTVSVDYYTRYVDNVCVITEGAEKKIKGNWISWEKYLEREIWNKYTPEELQDIVNEKDWNVQFKEYLFLKDVDPQFNWKTKYDNITGWHLSKIAERYTPQDKTIDFSKYPMLKLIDIRYLDKKDQPTVIAYVKEKLNVCSTSSV